MTDNAAVVLGDRIASVSGHQVIDVALECGLAAYDAEFVALDRALGVLLATLDDAVLHGAADVAVSLRTLVSQPECRPLRSNCRGPITGASRT